MPHVVRLSRRLVGRSRRRAGGRAAGVTALVLLLSGVLVAWALDGVLGLSFTLKTVPAEHFAAAPAAGARPRAAPGITAITGADSARLRLAARAVADALVARGRRAPAVRSGEAGAPRAGVLAVRAGAGGTGPSAEQYRLRGSGGGLLLDAPGEAGAAAGLYRLADRVRSGEDVMADGGRTVTPRLGLRLSDVGAVGLDADPARFAGGTDYSLNSDVVGSALLPRAPWVDAAAVARIAAQFRQFTDRALAEGYNGLVVPGFLEYVTFSGVGGGHDVYPAGDEHPARARAMAAAFAPVWKYAADMGMRVYFQTDMLALSPPLKDYLRHRFGGLRTEDPGLWSVYGAGLRELLDTMPFVSGLVVRTGEGGSAYRLPGWDYTSAIDVTTPAAVRAMLHGLLGALDAAPGPSRDLVFRTWSVGVGAVGDMHTEPASYDAVLGGIDDPHLIVSTKYGQGDFYSRLPLNPTLSGGSQRRIVEFQSRREFEGQGALPDDLGPLEQQALRTFLAANPRIVGVWDWTQTGGPLYAGPHALYLRTGFWQLWDVNVYLTSRLAWDPDTDVAAATLDWVRQNLSDDPATASAICRVLALSRQAVTQGLYIGPYADTSAKALGLEPPPMMWIFEWDIATGDSAALSSIYAASRRQFDAALAGGPAAVAASRQQQALLASTEPASWHSPSLRTAFANALAYQTDLLTTLDAYRATMLWHERWLASGSSRARQEWRAAETRYRAAAAGHERRYGHDPALPAYNFTAAGLGLARADRDPLMAWLARGLLVLLVALLALGAGAATRRLRGRPGAAALRALWLGSTRPWRTADLPLPAGRADRALVWLLPAVLLAASRAVSTWFLAPLDLAVSLGAWLLLGAGLRAAAGPGERAFRLAAAVGGAVLLRTALLLAVLAVRGPGYYWFAFWTSPHGRAVYVTLAWAAFLWVFAVAFRALRDGCGLSGRAAAGRVAACVGLPLAVGGAAAWAAGTERALSAWNDQMALLPWGLHRILGITTYLGIPTSLPRDAALAGTALVLLGAGLGLRAGAPAPAHPAAGPPVPRTAEDDRTPH